MNPAFAVEVTENTKTGPISTTYATQASCPKSCPLLRKGCYAETGFVGIQTAKLSKSLASPTVVARSEAAAIRNLTGLRPLRLHVVGDARTNAAARILAKAAEAYKKRKNQPVFTYSHSWKGVERGSFGSISVLASCHSLEEIKLAKARGYATAIVVKKFKSEKGYTVSGQKLIPCPAQTRKTTCESCRLCMKDDSLRRLGATIAFEAHGGPGTKQRAQKIAI